MLIILGLMGLRQKQLGPCVQIWTPHEGQSSDKSDLVPCPPEIGKSLEGS